jgi:formyl-CoA transferase/CoA:oxalate CoA-transferase
MSALNTRLASYWTKGQDPQANGSAHTVVAPYQVFATADGSAMAGGWGGDGWARFCKAIQRPDLVEDARFVTNHDRVANKEALAALLAPIFTEKTTDEWQALFHEAEALFAPVLGFSELFEHPQVRHSGLLQEVEHSSLGPIPQLGPVVAMSATPGSIAGPPPVLGEHSAEVLGELGLTTEGIAALESAGIVKTVGD